MAGIERKSGYLPTLDGWRAIAVLGVLCTHDAVLIVFGHSTGNYKGLGGWGVELFFAISGFLITWRIVEDESKVGIFRVKDFYVRRAFRIQPAALVYLTVIAVLALVGVLPFFSWRHWLGALLLFNNFLYHSQSVAQRIRGSFVSPSLPASPFSEVCS